MSRAASFRCEVAAPRRKTRAALGTVLLSVTIGFAFWPTVSLGQGRLAEVSIQVFDDGQSPLADVVASLHSAVARLQVGSGQADAVIDQIDNQFVPALLAVTVGTSISFPNSDNVRHHVYSFSPAKRFELPLYAGLPASPVLFDTPGIVVLGCNIHDAMMAHVLVLDTPYRGVTDASGAVVVTAPPGEYRIQLWHRQLPADAPVFSQSLVVSEAMATQEFVLTLDPPPPRTGNQRLLELQRRFRALGGD